MILKNKSFICIIAINQKQIGIQPIISEKITLYVNKAQS